MKSDLLEQIERDLKAVTLISRGPGYIEAMLPVVRAALAYEEAKALCDRLGTAEVTADNCDAWRTGYDDAGDAYKEAQIAILAAVRAFKEAKL